MDECDALLDDDSDLDAALCYYLFVNHGILPRVVIAMDTREKAFIFAMAKREIKARKKSAMS